MTLVKYTPQVLHNHARRSTEGWSAATVLLDVAGGLLSLSQVLLDAAARHDLSVLTGNPGAAPRSPHLIACVFVGGQGAQT